MPSSFVPLIPATSGWRRAWRIGEVVVTGENRKLRGNPVPVPICLPQTLQGLDRTEASAVTGRRLSVLVVRKNYNDILGFSSYLTENNLRLQKDQSVNNVYEYSSSYCLSQWPCGLRLRSMAARLLRMWVRIPSGAWMFVVSVLCCQVEVFATSWSLVQRSPTDCGVSLCVI